MFQRGRDVRFFKPSRSAHAVTDILLEELWTDFREEMIRRELWTDTVHLRFTVYLPQHKFISFLSYLIPVHLMDTQEARNNEMFSLAVRTRGGYAGRVFRNGEPCVADLEGDPDSLRDLFLTEKQQATVRDYFRLKSKMCAPLRVWEGKIAGVFAIESTDSINQTRFNDPNVLATIVSFSETIVHVLGAAYRLRSYRVR